MLIEQISEFELREPGPPGRIKNVGVVSPPSNCNFLAALPLPVIHV